MRKSTARRGKVFSVTSMEVWESSMEVWEDWDFRLDIFGYQMSRALNSHAMQFIKRCFADKTSFPTFLGTFWQWKIHVKNNPEISTCLRTINLFSHAVVPLFLPRLYGVILSPVPVSAVALAACFTAFWHRDGTHAQIHDLQQNTKHQ